MQCGMRGIYAIPIVGLREKSRHVFIIGGWLQMIAVGVAVYMVFEVPENGICAFEVTCTQFDFGFPALHGTGAQSALQSQSRPPVYKKGRGRGQKEGKSKKEWQRIDRDIASQSWARGLKPPPPKKNEISPLSIRS